MRLSALWWWIDRWRKSSAYMDMTLEEQGAYRNLLDEAHLRGGPLPLDERVLAKACGDALAWPRVKKAVLARFEQHADGWRNATLDTILHESLRRAKHQADYRARLHPPNNDGNNADNNAGHNERHNTNGSPSPSLDLDLITVSGKIKTVSPETKERVSEQTAILTFPTDGKIPQWHLTQEQIDRWSELYPQLNVPAECRKALAWIEAHNDRKKTARGMPRFLVAWLARSNDQPFVAARPPAKPKSNLAAITDEQWDATAEYCNRQRT